MANSIERFSNRVANYIKYRPDYPRDIIKYLAANCDLTPDRVLADVGCGPGVSSRMFLEHGCPVIGVEPNDAMRAAAAEQLTAFENFSVVNGASDNTTLKPHSVDMVVAAQAFHWFEPKSTRNEFHRILRPGGHIVLIWNERQLDTTPFLVDYEGFLLRHSTDYTKVRHENIDAEKLAAFFQKPYATATFPNIQTFDLDALQGRLLSSSYMPSEISAEMNAELEALFAKHAENGRISIFYDTRVYHSPV